VILATHDRDTIQRIGRRVLTLDRGQLASDVELVGSDPPALDPLANVEAEEGVEVPEAPPPSEEETPG
jgi:hypothetical protein